MNEERLMKILLAPHVSEKATNVADQHRQVVFRVSPDASREEVGRAVEHLFGVEVEAVRILNMPGKTRRAGRIQGRRPGFRKAYVALKPGFDIDFMGSV